MSKKLAVFDFDNTIIDDNSDIVVKNLLKDDEIPDSIKELYRLDGWTTYMQKIFTLLHKHKISEQTIRDAIDEIPAVDGMKELITQMVRKLNYDVIIVSDSNSVFIDQWLIHNGLKKYIKEVFTNPACFKNGLLEIKMYHHQTDCCLSTKNLCKGRILSEFLSEQKNNSLLYEQIVYSGDGKNDFCPILRLSEKDYACVRAGYACSKIIEEAKNGKSEGSKRKSYNVKAKVIVWNNGYDILNAIK